MNRWRLIALDMDGTLLQAGGTISEQNLQWIHRARNAGIEVTIATGRPKRMIIPYLELLGIQVPFVVANGSEVWTSGGVLLERHTINHDDIRFLYALAQAYGIHFWSSVVDQVFKPGAFPEEIERYQWLKFGFKSEEPHVMGEIWKRLKAYGRLELSSSDPSNIEVNPKGITKATGLQKVCDYLNITAQQVVTMGDGLNDVAMLRWAGLGVAMANAPAEVQAYADTTTDHHEQDGVAKAIQKLLSSPP